MFVMEWSGKDAYRNFTKMKEYNVLLGIAKLSPIPASIDLDRVSLISTYTAALEDHHTGRPPPKKDISQNDDLTK